MSTSHFAPGASVAEAGEQAIIEWIRSRVPATLAGVAVGIGDDAALVEPARNHLDVLTTDVLVEEVHFRREWSSPADIGRKALAVNLSDLAAMGATPRAALLSLALPPTLGVAVVEELVVAFLDLAATHRVAVVGGNVSRSPGPLVVDVTAVGAAKPRRALLRSTARPGDALYVSGTLGAAAAGLAWLQERGPAAETQGIASALERYRRPEPRVRLGQLVGRARAAGACIDVSDGLADALRQLASASEVGVRLDLTEVPVDAGAREVARLLGRDALALALSGGEDYELLFAVPRRLTRRFLATVAQAGRVPVTRVGQVTEPPALEMAREGRTEALPAGFTHFATASEVGHGPSEVGRGL